MGGSSAALACQIGEIVRAVPEPKLIQVNLVREKGERFGLRLERTGREVFVGGIDAGSIVLAWNEQHPHMQVSFGDKLVAVNHVQVDHSWKCWCSILLELRKDTVTMVVSQARAGDLSRLSLPHPGGEVPDQILPENFLDSMAKHSMAECDVVDCCICLEELDVDTMVVQLPCKHAFHRRCAETWLTQCPTFKFAKCPRCRQQLGTTTATHPEVRDADDVATYSAG